MRKKYTYKPTSSVKYGKGGKNKKKTYRSDGKHYDAQWGWISDITDPIVGLFGIESMDTMLGDIYDQAILDQTQAGVYGTNLAGDVEDWSDFGVSDQLQDYYDEGISITKPKKVSTEFVEGIKDTIGQQTVGVLGDISRTTPTPQKTVGDIKPIQPTPKKPLGQTKNLQPILLYILSAIFCPPPLSNHEFCS